MNRVLIGILVILAIVIGAAYFSHEKNTTIGGDRDDHGCLISGGYSFDPQVSACLREFDLTPQIKQAAALAVQNVGPSYALTIISFNSYEQRDSYDIVLEEGENRMQQTIYIRNGAVVEPHIVHLYYYNAEKDRDNEGNILCSSAGLVPVERTIAPDDPAPIEATLRQLLGGRLTDTERASGISTNFPLPNVTLESATLASGVLTLTFSDPDNRTSGGSCRVGILRAQIEETAKQFAGVKEIQYSPVEVFQP